MGVSFGVDIGYIIVAIICFIAWLIRLESKVLAFKENLANTNDNIKKNKDELSDRLDFLQQNVTEILKGLSRLEGKLEKN